MPLARITSPDSPALAELCAELASRASDIDQTGAWPAEGLALCGEAGVYEWFLPSEWGGQDWSEVDVVRGYLALSAACLTTTFIITQRTGACRRIACGENEGLKSRLLPPLAAGDAFATVGISHLTTSRRHLKQPVLRATPADDRFVLDGFSPWVTGGRQADCIVTGAVVMDGPTPTNQQLLAVVPKDEPGVTAAEPPKLVGLNSSHTGQVHFNGIRVTEDWLIAGPVENVMMASRASRPGGHETSTLALGLATAALDYLASEATRRDDLQPASEALDAERAEILADLLAIASGHAVCTNESLRQRANSLVLRATQAALAAAKGAGYVATHPAGRWCREALFFLVWSCPQPVMNANLCELAGLAE
jgi:alkylation response protein AidB-like acyl-CoA dehydrogenase